MPAAATLRSAALAAACALLACAAGPQPGAAAARPRLAEQPIGDLVEQWIVSPGNLFLKRPRPDFGRYRSLHVEPPALFYAAHTSPPIAQDDAMLRREFLAVVTREIARVAGLGAATARGAGVLRVRAELNDLEVDRARTSANSRVTSIIQPSGNVFFVLEIADDATGEALVRFAARRPMPGGIYTGPWAPDLDRARQVMRAFGGEATEALGRVFGLPGGS